MKTISVAWAVGCLAAACLAGCQKFQNAAQPLTPGTSFDVYVVSATASPRSKQAIDPASNTMIHLALPPVISASDVASVQFSEAQAGQPSLIVNLTPAGATKLTAATATPGAGMRLAVVANGAVLAAPKVLAPLASGFRVTGDEIVGRGRALFEELTESR